DDKKHSKNIRKVIGVSFIVLAAITGFYQWRYSKLTFESKEYVVVAIKDIYENNEINEQNIALMPREKATLVEGAILDLKQVVGTIAKTRIRVNEQIIAEDIQSKTEWDKRNLVLVSIKGVDDTVDPFVAYEVKPYDKVDILYFDKDGVYEGKPFLENISVEDLKSAEGVSYKNRKEGFKATFATLWVDKTVAQTIYKRQKEGGTFKFILHRQRSDYEAPATNNTIPLNNN
ncbi:MAG: hypothetical protein QXG00_07310, partial [Candidatus Woesearchaeota archaeon]